MVDSQGCPWRVSVGIVVASNFATEDILTKIRYLNQVAVSVREGWIDEEGANQEIELTERQLHEAVDRLRHLAGVEE